VLLVCSLSRISMTTGRPYLIGMVPAATAGRNYVSVRLLRTLTFGFLTRSFHPGWLFRFNSRAIRRAFRIHFYLTIKVGTKIDQSRY
jgi:hypothetical protein